MKKRPKILAQREKTHGSFRQNARLSQAFKWALGTGDRLGDCRTDYADVQREALDMIALKLSRIASGKADERDHWDDIIGYCQLVLEDIGERNADT
jgi:hypothetical protein